MSNNRKFYVVWEGRAPGIYDNWEDCKAQVEGYEGAKFKGFTSQTAATEAFRGRPSDHIGILRSIARHNRSDNADSVNTRGASIGGRSSSGTYTPPPSVILDAIAVDGACARNPGPMEYQGVNVADGSRIFHFGPLDGGTNNIAEYLALIHALALLDRQGNTHTVVYSDSRTAQSWLRRGGHKSTLARTPHNGRIFELLARADAWLQAHPRHARVIKWDTATLGEIPADFGRK